MYKWISSLVPTLLIAAVALTITILSCSESSVGTDDVGDTFPAYIDTIFIVDQTGKKWDITYAVTHFGMDSAGFIYGGGGLSSLPILDPQFYVEGDSAYPDDSAGFKVIGTTINGESRAYPTLAIGPHEVVDDVFGSTYVVIAY